MADFLLAFRLVALAIVAFWVTGLLLTRGKPADWQPHRADRVRGVRISRNLFRLAGVLGIVAGIAVFAWSFALEAMWSTR